MGRPRLDLTQEMRFGVVMYGGSSLAVYINGVAQELLNLVKATAPDATDASIARVADEDLRSTQRVYRALGQLVRRNAPPVKEEPSEGAAVLTRFVVDLISGSSAGGINGVYLAKALANDQRLEQLKQLWVNEGDFAELVNDRRSIRAFTRPQKRLLGKRPPRSLLNGQRMYYRLLEALEGMDETGGGAAGSPLVDEVDLFVTATDVNGVVIPLILADKVVREKRYRAAWHLRSRPTTDFGSSCNPLLAFVARSTSAFPFAFEPVALEDVRPIAALFPGHDDGLDEEALERLFADYRAVGDPAYEKRPFGDGGSLDNKPFGWIIDSLPQRRSTVPVDRRLLYVEPDPGDSPTGHSTPSRPDPLTNTLAQALLLPRKETIRDDLERVRRRNEAAARTLEMISAIDDAMYDVPPPAAPPTQTWLTLGPASLADASAFRLKVRQVAAELAALASRVTEQPPGSDYDVAVQSIIRAWVEREHSIRHRKQFLLDFDFGYRLRRINFVQRRADELHDLDDTTRKLLRQAVDGADLPADDEGRAAFREALLCAKSELNSVYVDLCKRRSDLGEELRSLAGVFEERNLTQVLKGLKTGAADREAARTVAERHASDLAEAFAQAAAATKAWFAAASGRCTSALAPLPTPDPAGLARDALRYSYERYEQYDNAVLPLMTQFDGELDPVEVLRISPLDALSLRHHQLAGMTLGHFGAFADPGWRRHDIMWGRLDTADRLITMLLPDGHPQRKRLLDEAQRTIVEEELVDTESLPNVVTNGLGIGPGPAEPGQLVAEVKRAEVERLLAKLRDPRFEPPTERSAESKLSTAGRATTVASDVLRGVSADRRVAQMTGIIAAVGRIVTGLAEAAVPRSLFQVLVRYWLQLLLLASVLLVVLGVLVGDTGGSVTQIGWIGVGLALGGQLAISLTSLALRQSRRAARLGIAIAVLAVLGIGFALGSAWGG